MQEFTKLDVACGQNKQEGFTGIDIVEIDGVNIVHDLTVYPWPIESDSITDIFCSHYIEHVQDLLKFYDELYRILKVGGKAVFVAPYGNSDRAWQDPTHVRPILESTFLYTNKKWREDNKLSHYPTKADFDFTYGYSFFPQWLLRNEEARNFALTHYRNVASDIHVTLTRRN